MTEAHGGAPSKRALPRRSLSRALLVIELAVFAAFVLTILGFGFAATMVAMAVLKGLGAIFEGLGGALVLLALSMFPGFLELLALLTTGQFIPLVMRLARLLSSS